MAAQADLIDFDIIETHKENIQSLPGGRSARALVNLLSPQPSGKSSSPCDNSTKTLNDAIRQEYETELKSIDESDDPLDIFDRYVKWTLNAYPSAQATSQSQLLPLLERATKTFLSSSHYKNDPRYLKLWLHYIRLFSDSPRETFAFLARHKIGEGLALFYEEFSAWLEGAGRWNQAEEVYKLGIEREARPTERLMRKFGQFQQRYEQRPQNPDEPSSPALPTVRPALAARVDPFAPSTRPTDVQAPRPNAGVGGGPSRSSKPKMAIFSDADGAPSEPAVGSATKGWENIGSIKDRKKENTVEAKPWAGETLKAGKRVGHVQKMEIFRDQSSQAQDSMTYESSHPDQTSINPKTGRPERVFVNLAAVYPNIQDPSLEMSFEELRAARREWTSKVWQRSEPKQSIEVMQPIEATGNKKKQKSTLSIFQDSPETENLEVKNKPVLDENTTQSQESLDSRTSQTEKPAKTKRFKIREVSQETQTIKTKFNSPTGPKIRKKNASAEPTMTFHSKAATDEIYSIFNQPLKCETDEAKDDTVSVGGESDGDYEDDDYTSAGESTGTGRISCTTSEFGDEETSNSTKLSLANGENEDTNTHSVNGGADSEWTEFTTSKHVPKASQKDDANSDEEDEDQTTEQDEHIDQANEENDMTGKTEDEVATPDLPESQEISQPTRYIPVPPEENEAPTRPYRNQYQSAQNRLPFMTPIVEKTESSLAPSTVAALALEKEYFNSKTPSRSNNAPPSTALDEGVNDSPLSSPFQELITPERKKKSATEATDVKESPPKKLKLVVGRSPPPKPIKGPVIQDLQVSPCDETVRSTIIKTLYPPMSSFAGFHDHSNEPSSRSTEIRKYIKSLGEKKNKSGSERTQTGVVPPILRLPGSSKVYGVKRELGKGAFAPVYLVETMRSEGDENEDPEDAVDMAALKMEDPPTTWEFLMIRTLQSRLGGSSRTVQSLIQAHECHIYSDECFMFLDYSDQGTLLDLVNLFRADNARNGKSTDAGLDEVLAMFFSVELFRVIEDCHRSGIIHGDLKADNCLVRLGNHMLEGPYDPEGQDGWSSKGLTLIDFGRSIDVRKFKPEAQFIADWETGPQDCAEMRELRPWTYQADYFGVAGVIHSLLFGKYIETVVDKSAANGSPDIIGAGSLGAKKVWKLKEGFKRYWQGNIWSDVFGLLLNPTMVPLEGGMGDGEMEKMPLHKGMQATREKMEAWLREEGERKGLRTLISRAERMVKEYQQSKKR